MPDEIRLDDALNRASISIEPRESDDERVARLRSEREEARFDLVKRYVLFFAFLTAAAAISIVAVYEGFLDPTAPIDTKRWAQTILSSLLTGALTFMLGQATAKKSR